MAKNKTKLFLDTICKYDIRDLFVLLIVCSHVFNDDDIKMETYEGVKNLFSKIISFYNFSSKGDRIDFYDEAKCNDICDTLMQYLLKKYGIDHDELSRLASQNKISQKQFYYELSSPKTYPRTFIETLLFKFKPFENFLNENYGLSLVQLQEYSTKILKLQLSPFDYFEVLGNKPTNITGYLPNQFLDDLISVNEKSCDLYSINAFSKKVCCPIIKIKNEYHMLSGEVFIDNFYKCLHRLYSKRLSKEEKDIFSNQKGKIFNDSCEALFNNCGFENVYSNFLYDKGEIDLLIDEKDVLIVVECKSRNYTDKISGLSESFVKANDSNLDSASGQVHRFLDCLKSKKCVSLKKDDKKIRIDINKYEYIIPLVINIDNLAEVNADFSQRDRDTLFISFDDLMIIMDIIEKRKWLLVDLFNQILIADKTNMPSDDIIDIFAFYCVNKDISALFSKEASTIIYKLGNDYFQDYFSYKKDKNPIKLFKNNIATYQPSENKTYKEIISEYHVT